MEWKSNSACALIWIRIRVTESNKLVKTFRRVVAWETWPNTLFDDLVSYTEIVDRKGSKKAISDGLDERRKIR